MLALRGRPRRIMASLLPLAFLTGCLAAPKPASSLRPSVGATGVAVPADRSGYWDASGPAVASDLLGRGRRVAITSFDVELVDLQFVAPTRKQLLFKPPPIPIGPLGLLASATEVVGLGRRNTWIREDDQRRLTAELQGAFIADLQRRGIDVVPQGDLAACPGFARLSKRKVVNSSPLLLLNPIGTDTGQVMHTRTMAAPGLGVRRRWSPGRDAAEVQILAETHADVALDVCLRVGTYDHKAAMEHRSTIRLTTARGTTTLQARRSILSDAVVTEGQSAFVPVAGRTLYVVPDALGRELQLLLPEFLTLAIETPGP